MFARVKDINIMCGLVLGYIMAGVMMLASCSTDDNALTEDITQSTTDAPVEVRPRVHHEVTVSLGGDATTRVVATSGIVKVDGTDTDGLTFSWSADETLGVYIKHANNTITRAGSISSNGEVGTDPRTFTGSVIAKADGESYIYMHPDLGTKSAIDYTSQTGTLGSTAHLSQYIPLVWREGNHKPENQGYVIHLTLTMNENPGAISAITLHTMKQGTDGTTEDRIFPKRFDINNLALDVNSTLSSKANGLSLSADYYTNEIKLRPATGQSFTATPNNGIYKVEAYIAASSVKNLDVFRTKYNVEITAENGTFCNDYRSFPGQDKDGVNAGTGLAMLDNGYCYNLSTNMSKGYAMTIISEKYRVNSLLGMWNDFGKVYDPFNLVAYSGGNADINDADVPQQLKDTKAAILSRYNNNTSGSPTWLGVGNNTLSILGRPDDKQENVTYNNILITKPTEVFVTFVSDFAWNRNLLGYYHYPTDDESTITFSQVKNTIIFPDFSKPGHEPFAKGLTGHNDANSIGSPEDAPLQEFETVKLLYTDANGFKSTIFPTGTTIGFMMMINVKATTTTLLTWSQWRIFTNTVWNKENTTAHGASANWTNAYDRNNFFASGDVGTDATGSIVSGLAFYGVKDAAADNNAAHAYSAMMFMVSTSEQTAMQTQNTAYFNIGSGNYVIQNQQ